MKYLEEERGNHIRTRNQRLAIVHVFFEYIASRIPEMLGTSKQVALIPQKRVPPPESFYLEQYEIKAIFSSIIYKGKYSERDRAILLFLYNTGARVQEVADLCVGNIEFEPNPRAHLHGKGGKWRVCPLWKETASQIRHLLANQGSENKPESPVFLSQRRKSLTRFGIYKIVRRHTHNFDKMTTGKIQHVTPHVFRHTTAVHLLESGVEINVIRGWLGHVKLETTNHYAEISFRNKEKALEKCTLPENANLDIPSGPVWRNDKTLLSWLDSL